jgi:hypothetical protein
LIFLYIKLVRHGFFVKLKEVPGSSVSYRPVPHKEWEGKNPNCCLKKDENPWANEDKDALAVWLFAASDRTMKCFPNFMRGMRKLGHSDARLREHFVVFYPFGYLQVRLDATGKGTGQIMAAAHSRWSG